VFRAVTVHGAEPGATDNLGGVEPAREDCRLRSSPWRCLSLIVSQIKNIMPLPHVSSEGGPILVADFDTLCSWRGAFHDSGDYERACQTLGAATLAQIQIGSHQAIVWDIGGPGTADIVVASPSHISIVRIWPDASWSDEECEQAVVSAATERFGTEERAQLSIRTSYLLALWAPEDMSSGGIPLGEHGVPDDLSIGDGGAYIRIPPGRYSVTTCEWQTGTYDVTKIDLRLT